MSRRGRRDSPSRPPTRCGTKQMYCKYGCRCQRCRAAYAAWVRARRAAKRWGSLAAGGLEGGLVRDEDHRRACLAWIDERRAGATGEDAQQLQRLRYYVERASTLAQRGT